MGARVGVGTSRVDDGRRAVICPVGVLDEVALVVERAGDQVRKDARRVRRIGDSALLGNLPPLAQFVIIAAIPPGATFLAGYIAPHTPRPDLYAYSGPAQPWMPPPPTQPSAPRHHTLAHNRRPCQPPDRE